MNFQRGRGREALEINLIPLIDVLLVILIFLMITTTYSKFAELQINLPTADAEKQLERPNEVNVMVSADGRYVINHAGYVFKDINDLAQQMRIAASAGGDQKEPIVVISADAKATHQSVIYVMEAARLAGLAHISFATQSTK
jgi:biopolymer transport protein ExbD